MTQTHRTAVTEKTPLKARRECRRDAFRRAFAMPRGADGENATSFTPPLSRAEAFCVADSLPKPKKHEFYPQKDVLCEFYEVKLGSKPQGHLDRLGDQMVVEPVETTVDANLSTSFRRKLGKQGFALRHKYLKTAVDTFPALDKRPKTAVDTLPAVNKHIETAVDALPAFNKCPKTTVDGLPAVNKCLETAVDALPALNKCPKTTVDGFPAFNKCKKTAVYVRLSLDERAKTVVYDLLALKSQGFALFTSFFVKNKVTSTGSVTKRWLSPVETTGEFYEVKLVSSPKGLRLEPVETTTMETTVAQVAA